MSLTTKIVAAARRAARATRRGAFMYGVGGPVGAYHAWKLARLRKKMARVNQCIARERELHRDHLRTLNFEFDEIVREQQAMNVAAAQFWSACESWAGR